MSLGVPGPSPLITWLMSRGLRKLVTLPVLKIHARCPQIFDPFFEAKDSDMTNHCFIGKMVGDPWDCTLKTINQPHIHLISRGYLLGISPFKGKQLGYHLGQYHPWDDCIFTYMLVDLIFFMVCKCR